MPQGLYAREVAFGRRWVDFLNSTESVPLTAADLDPATWARLLMRAETRAWRLEAVGRHARRDAWALAAELKLVIPTADAARVRGWLAWVDREIEGAERALDGWRKLRDFIQTHEPEADAWLRRRIAGLDAPQSDTMGLSPEQVSDDDDGDDQPAVALRS